MGVEREEAARTRAGTRLIEDQLMNEIHRSPGASAAARARPRRRLALLAVPLIVAAAAGAVLATTAATGHHHSAAAHAPAYTVRRGAHGVVRLAITDPDAKRLDLNAVQRDLNRLGVPALVHAGEPGCSTPPTAGAPDVEAPAATGAPAAESAPFVQGVWRIETAKGGKPLLDVRPEAIPAGAHLLVVFPLARTDPAHAGYVITAHVQRGAAPACVPPFPGTGTSFAPATP
ncbi:hypothetical protein [Actinacidiphila acididurans]|uniref:Uncharacterized protein n=1 Tax=Actinacidiphila acididurans TaxID=2784346 RepID=A0ABS2TWW8_9ACTN|nr:hypothetical protein [Actinacidiphila acididurans]MBM9507842.1 hypothetical protein [Actinacidiphila acididurans]